MDGLKTKGLRKSTRFGCKKYKKGRIRKHPAEGSGQGITKGKVKTNRLRASCFFSKTVFRFDLTYVDLWFVEPAPAAFTFIRLRSSSSASLFSVFRL